MVCTKLYGMRCAGYLAATHPELAAQKKEWAHDPGMSEWIDQRIAKATRYTSDFQGEPCVDSFEWIQCIEKPGHVWLTLYNSRPCYQGFGTFYTGLGWYMLVENHWSKIDEARDHFRTLNKGSFSYLEKEHRLGEKIFRQHPDRPVW